jgi:hypothetical protein
VLGLILVILDASTGKEIKRVPMAMAQPVSSYSPTVLGRSSPALRTTTSPSSTSTRSICRPYSSRCLLSLFYAIPGVSRAVADAPPLLVHSMTMRMEAHNMLQKYKEIFYGGLFGFGTAVLDTFNGCSDVSFRDELVRVLFILLGLGLGWLL